MMICLEILLYYECSTVSNTFNVYQAFNYRKIKNLFVVSARFCEIYLFCKYSCIPLTLFKVLTMIRLEDLVAEQMCLLLIWQSHCENERMENKLVF